LGGKWKKRDLKNGIKCFGPGPIQTSPFKKRGERKKKERNQK
jgi:hypothetical protein